MKKYGNEINGNSILRILRRVALIFAIGLFINIFPFFGKDYSSLRVMGVLQRIAIVYGLGSIICLTIRREYLWIVVIGLLLLYWVLLMLFGGSHPFSLESNFVLKVDLALFGKNHLYSGYGTPFDPEGLMSTMPAISSFIIGYYIGEMVDKGTACWSTFLKLILLGISAFGLGYLWGMVLPVNKPLWTGSFVLYTTGIALTLFAFIYLVADVLNFQVWATFFLVFGTNALFAGFLSVIWTKVLLFIKIGSAPDKISLYEWFYEKICVPVAGNFNGSLIFALLQMLLIWSVTLLLYRKKIMLRV
jgi:predicted acyltransferase